MQLCQRFTRKNSYQQKMSLDVVVVLLFLLNNGYSAVPGPSDSNRNIQPQRGPVCFDCAVTDDPKSCLHLTICNIGQVCMLREIQDHGSGLIKYHSACEDPLVCAGYGIPTPSGRRQTRGCQTCCYLDYCNDQCGVDVLSTPQVPVTGLPVNTGDGLFCYNCPYMDTPNACRTFTRCGTDQVCMIRDVFSPTTGKLEYSSACESVQVCSALVNLGDPSDSRCHRCCSTSFCNDRCDTVTSPTTSSPVPQHTTRQTTRQPATVSTVTPTPTDLHTGRVCYSCDSVDSLSNCLNIAQCQPSQICMLSELAPDQSGTIKYRAACEDTQVCDALSSIHTSTSSDTCHVCCDLDLCNGNCVTQVATPTPTTNIPTTRWTTPPRPTTKQTPPPVATTDGHTDRIQCYQCSSMVTPDDCTHSVTCSDGHVCMIKEVPFPGSGMREYTTGCEKKVVCDVVNSLPGGKRGSLCHACCETSLCNVKCG